MIYLYWAGNYRLKTVSILNTLFLNKSCLTISVYVQYVWHSYYTRKAASSCPKNSFDVYVFAVCVFFTHVCPIYIIRYNINWTLKAWFRQHSIILQLASLIIIIMCSFWRFYHHIDFPSIYSFWYLQSSDSISLGNILHHKSVKSRIPSYL